MDEERARALLGEERHRLESLLRSVEADHELAAPGSPTPDEVVVSVHAAGVANWDDFVRTGDWDVGRRPPLALGVEAAGVVAAVGQDKQATAPTSPREGSRTMAKRSRSAITGRYMRASTAKRNPKTTVTESTRRRKRR